MAAVLRNWAGRRPTPRNTAKKKLGWTFAHTTVIAAVDGRPAGNIAQRRKSHPSTCGRASQWMLHVESSSGVMAHAMRKLPPNAQCRRNHSHTPAEMAAA